MTKKKHVFNLSFLIILVVCILVVCSGLNDTNKENGIKQDEVPKQEVRVYNHNLNEKILFEGIEYTFLCFEATTVGDNPNNVIAKIKLDIKNTTSKTIYFEESSWFSSYDKYVYSFYCDDVQFGGQYGYDSYFLLATDSIMPYETMTNKQLWYEVPKDVINTCQKIELKFCKNKTAEANEVHIVTLKNNNSNP